MRRVAKVVSVGICVWLVGVLPAGAQDSASVLAFDAGTQRMFATRVCKIDAAGNMLSDWVELAGGTAELPSCVSVDTLLYDGAGVDPATGALVGGECIGPCPSSPAPGCRYLQGPTATYRCHSVVDDMTLRAGVPGQRAAYFVAFIYRGVTEAMYLDIFHDEQFHPCGGPAPSSGRFAGIRAQFPSAGCDPLPCTHVYVVDLCQVPELWLQLPEDRSGAFELRTWRNVSQMPGLPLTNGQFGIWGIQPGSGRPGSTGPRAYYDDGGSAGCPTQNRPNLAYSTIDNELDPCGECYNESGVAIPCGISQYGIAYSFWAGIPPCQSWLAGDALCDQRIDNFDIDAWVLAVSDPVRYALEYPNCNRTCVADINRDGHVDSFDIDPFVACISEPPAAGQPCP